MLDFIQENDFNEKFYLESYPDVKEAIERGEFTSGFHHYVLAGYLEGRTFIAGFNERYYIEHNPDVKHAIEKGEFVSGLHHYLRYGLNESRIVEFANLQKYEKLVLNSIRRQGINLRLYLLKH